MKIEKHHQDPVLIGTAHKVEIHIWGHYMWANDTSTFIRTLHTDEVWGVKRED